MKKGMKILLPIVSISLLILSLFNRMDADLALSMTVVLIGLSSVLNGYSKKGNEDKKESRSLILTGVVVIILSILALFFKNT